MAIHNRSWRLATDTELSGRSWLRRRIPFVCHWQRDLNEAGVETNSSWTFAFGVPLLALSVLAAMVVTALLSPNQGGPTIWSIGLILLAAIPWAQWLILGDDGPNYPFVVLALGPICLLAIGRWFFDPFSLGSDLASPLIAFPCLLVVALIVAFGPRMMAIVSTVVGYLAFGGPMIVAWLTGDRVGGFAVMTWNLIFLMTVIAAFAMLLSYRASTAVSEAREAKAWQAATEERRQVARDVHDVLAHTLSVTMLHITAARMAMRRNDSEQAIEALEEAERHGRSSLTDVRQIVRLLRSDDSSALDVPQPGLADVENLVEGYRIAGLPIEFSMSVSGEQRAPSVETAMFRVLQEALTNAARYGSGAASVSLAVSELEMSLQVVNPIANVQSKRTPGSGLIGMKERITAAGGTFEASNQRDSWVVNAVVPIGGSA
ncbi:MAG: sensor histidine kinase [Thermomicrobiales bacterium]